MNANDKFFTGALTMEVGEMTEEITVDEPRERGAVGERRAGFTLDSEALKNIAAGER